MVMHELSNHPVYVPEEGANRWAEPIELAGVAQNDWSQLSENYLHKMIMG